MSRKSLFDREQSEQMQIFHITNQTHTHTHIQIVPSYTDELWNSETRVCRLYYIYIYINDNAAQAVFAEKFKSKPGQFYFVWDTCRL